MNRHSTWIAFSGILFLATATASVAAQELDSAEFDFKYSASDIFDGANFLNDWSVAGDTNAGDLLDGASIEINERNNIVMKQTPDNRNFWLQQDTEDSPWEDGVDGGEISWTVEVRAHLIGTELENDEVNNGFMIWGADGLQRGIATIQEDSIQSFGRPGEILDEQDNDDGFHTYRMTYDADEDLYFMYRDGILTGEDGFAAQAFTGNNRLIVGDCCTNANDLTPFIFEELEIEYIRYDLDGAFAPAANEAIVGDFDDSGVLDIADINLLVAESASGANNAAFDLTEDGNVNADDVNAWVKDLKNTWIGDSDLNGEFNSGDFVAIFGAGKFEQDVDANWSEGDWTGDLRFDSSDLVAAFTDGGFELGPRDAINQVPEPAGCMLIALGLFAFCVRTRRSF